MTDADACDACGQSVRDALSRTVRLSVDRAEIDAQQLCPDCFADWIARYEREMQPDVDGEDEGDGIIVD
ncbi:MAG: hypothetical protein ABEJ78_10015 [Haloferacaceae archaeon]